MPIISMRRICLTAVDSLHRNRLAVRQLDAGHGAAHIEDAVGPHYAALFVHPPKAPVVDAVDDGRVAAFELCLATERHGVEAAVVTAAEAGVVSGRGRDSILDTIAVVGKRIVTLSIVVFEARQVGVGAGD